MDIADSTRLSTLTSRNIASKDGTADAEGEVEDLVHIVGEAVDLADVAAYNDDDDEPLEPGTLAYPRGLMAFCLILDVADFVSVIAQSHR